MKTKSAPLAFLSVFALALVPRALGLGSYLTADEQLWIERSIRFLHALLNGNFSATNQAGHPGVITMWLGALFIGLRTLMGRYVWLNDFMLPAQLAIAVSTAACIAAMYLLLRRIGGPLLAALAAAFLILDPFYLALSRIIHVDALLASLMCVSLLFLVAALENPERSEGLLFGSAVFAGLALLEKLPGIYMFPFAAALLGLYPLGLPAARRSGLRKGAMRFAAWAAIAVATLYLLWPALWSNPLILVHSLERAPGIPAHEGGQFFLGHPVRNPGPLFYPVVLLFRSTPLSFIFALGATAWMLYGWARHRTLSRPEQRLSLTLLAYIAGFMLMVSLDAKKMDRYLLPVFPALDILAAIGVNALLIRLQRGLRPLAGKVLSATTLAFLAVVALVPVVRTYPYYLSYYSPLAGGPSAAVHTLLVGRGEGLDQVARYLNALPNAGQITVATEFPYLLRIPFRGHVLSTQVGAYKPGTLDRADYLVIYISGRQKQRLRLPAEVIRYYRTHRPIYRVVINGIDYADVYRLRPPDRPRSKDMYNRP